MCDFIAIAIYSFYLALFSICVCVPFSDGMAAHRIRNSSQNWLYVYAKHKIQSNFMWFECVFYSLLFVRFCVNTIEMVQWTLTNGFDYLSSSNSKCLCLTFHANTIRFDCACEWTLFAAFSIFYRNFMFEYKFVIKNEYP